MIMKSGTYIKDPLIRIPSVMKGPSIKVTWIHVREGHSVPREQFVVLTKESIKLKTLVSSPRRDIKRNHLKGTIFVNSLNFFEIGLKRGHRDKEFWIRKRTKEELNFSCLKSEIDTKYTRDNKLSSRLETDA